MVPLNPPYEDQYVYNVASEVPISNNNNTLELQMTSFVFKIFTPKDNISVYIWTVGCSIHSLKV